MASYEQSLLQLARIYSASVLALGSGRSLARVVTVVVNRGSFFHRLEGGTTCSVRNLEKFADYFRNPENWPEGHIPPDAINALKSIGRPIAQAA